MADLQEVLSTNRLPTLPAAALKLLELTKSDDVCVRDIADTIKTDPAIAAKMLQFVNSSNFGFRTDILTVERAVTLMGINQVATLALGFSLAKVSMVAGPLHEHYRNCWLKSVIQAQAAGALAENMRSDQQCESFLAGLLMDIGRLGLLTAIGDRYSAVMETERNDPRLLVDIEEEMLGFNHVHAGETLLGKWGLPKSLIRCIRYQHATLDELRSIREDHDFDAVRTAAVAATVGDYYCSANKAAAMSRLGELAAQFFGDTTLDLDLFLKTVNTRVTEQASLFALEPQNLPDCSDLIAQANEQLAELVMREQLTMAQVLAKNEAIEQKRKELESQNRNLMARTLRDSLTGIYNRPFFEESLQREGKRCARDAATVGLLFIDVDDFKQINDRHGHVLGDSVLVCVAAAVQETLRESDILARYGGDEFVALVTAPTEEGLHKVAERVRARVENEVINHGGRRILVTVSVGAAIEIPKTRDRQWWNGLVEAADQAMYDSKLAGRNRVRVRSLLDDFERHMIEFIERKRFSRWLIDARGFSKGTIRRVLAKQISERRSRPQTGRQRIGILAQNEGLLDEQQARQVLEYQDWEDERFGRSAVQLGYLSEDQVAYLLAMQQETPESFAALLASTHVVRADEADQLLSEYLQEMRRNEDASCQVASVM